MSRNMGSEFGLSNYRYFIGIQTRWADNDSYGHINNSVYHYFVDTVINNYLIWHCGMATGEKAKKMNWKHFMVENKCIYKRPLQFPQILLAGVGIRRIGTSSVHYSVGFFEPKSDYSAKLDVDPLTSLGIGSQGLLISPSHPEKLNDISRFYKHDAAVVGNPVHVFVESQSDKPLKQLDQYLKENLENIKIENINKL
uniref:Thioesterase domain-containing protein n=1 Tax=Ciona savignyi TaxID=51511 RepID=H2YC91_CIOSA